MHINDRKIQVKLLTQDFIGSLDTYREMVSFQWTSAKGVDHNYRELIREYDRGGIIVGESNIPLRVIIDTLKHHIEESDK